MRSVKYPTSLVAVPLLIAALVPSMASAQSQPTQDKATVEQGRTLAFTRSKGNCLACHQIKGGDLAGNIAPPLTDIKARFPDRQKLYDRIWDETKYNPMTVMPPFGRNRILDKDEIQKIVSFLYTL